MQDHGIVLVTTEQPENPLGFLYMCKFQAVTNLPEPYDRDCTRAAFVVCQYDAKDGWGIPFLAHLSVLSRVRRTF